MNQPFQVQARRFLAHPPALAYLGLFLTMIIWAVVPVFLKMLLAVLRTSKNYFIQAPIRAFVYFFRETPLLVQMFIIYYGFGQFEAIKASFVWFFFKEAWFCALFAFTLNTAAYTTEIIRGSIEATPHGEVEAARAAGMSRLLMLHGSSLASVITIVDITVFLLKKLEGRLFAHLRPQTASNAPKKV